MQRNITLSLIIYLCCFQARLPLWLMILFFSQTLDRPATQHYCCVMIPKLIDLNNSPWKVLPQGVHSATLTEVAKMYAINPHRRSLFDGLRKGAEALAAAGCKFLYLDGSYVTAKPKPGDYDACWDPTGVSPQHLDPVFLNFDNQRHAQKVKFKGEFFPFMLDAGTGQTFLDFFQTDRFSGEQKGILSIDLSIESFSAVTGGQP
jgi:hypothetical protein